MKIEKLFIYLFTFTLLLIAGGHINADANTISQDTTMLENNSSNSIIFPDAYKKTEQVGDYVKSFSTKVSNTKLDLKNSKKQLADAKTKEAKNDAIKRINKSNDNLANLNNNKTIILSDAKQSIKLAENKKKNAKNNDEHINANVSLNRSEISYSQLNKDFK